MSTFEPSAVLRELLTRPGPVLALTGAGVSAESGLATFRGPGGLWEGHDPMTLATPEAFARDPDLVWRFYSWRRSRAAAASPNGAHLALAALDGASEEFLLATQNVDGLHERAGSRRIVRLHGSLWRLRCSACQDEQDDLREDLGPLPPRHSCGGLLRPGVVWFGEPLPWESFEQAVAMARRARLVLVAGTSGMVHPAASIPEIARDAGAYVVEINPERTPLSHLAEERFEGPAGTVLPRILEAAGIPGRESA
jgi:NAD-dependent deacetylase